MILMLTPETVMVEVSRACAERVARDFSLPSSMVNVAWEKTGDGIRPSVDVRLPPVLPPDDLDVNDAAAFAAWQEEQSDLPGLRDLLKAKGIDNPDAIIRLHVSRMMDDLKTRLAALEAR